MTLLDIVHQLGLGVIGLSAFVTLYFAILVPIMGRIGKVIYPDGDEASWLVGFLALLIGSIGGIAIWFLGGWLLGILQSAI